MTGNRELQAFEPGSLMRRMFRDVDRLFEHRGAFPFFRPVDRELGDFPWWPELDMTERDHHLVVRVDLPGMKKEEVSVEVGEHELTVSGERTRERETGEPEWRRSERSYGAFRRTVPLPEGVKSADVKATFADGVLELTVPLPKTLESRATRIPIADGTTERTK